MEFVPRSLLVHMPAFDIYAGTNHGKMEFREPEKNKTHQSDRKNRLLCKKELSKKELSKKELNKKELNKKAF